VSSWIDESLILSELVGALVLLAIGWVIVLKNQLWQHWLRQRYQEPLVAVASALGLTSRSGWKARIEARGRRGAVRVSVQWRAGVGPHKLLVKARRNLRTRRWVGTPDAPPARVCTEVERLVAELSS